jgi:NADPH-dependent curcumin reductase CurA
MTTSREVHLTAYPQGKPTPDILAVVERELAEPKAGEVLVEVLFASVDPYMRGRMRPEVKSYIPPFQLNQPLDGGAVGRVVASRAEGLAEGDVVLGNLGMGWRTHAVLPGGTLQKVDASRVPASAYLGVLGMPGLTAWAGLTQIIKPKQDETLYVSGAAGAVGSLVCQLGKHRGMTVYGSAGSEAKRRWLEEKAGVAKAFDYRAHDAGSLTRALYEVAPKGIDGYFENVGGMQLDAVLGALAQGGRIALCGMIDAYNATDMPEGPRGLVNLIGRSGLMKGFIVTDYAHLRDEFVAEVAPLLASGEIAFEETVTHGIERMGEAFIGLFEGANTGKAVVRVAE